MADSSSSSSTSKKKFPILPVAAAAAVVAAVLFWPSDSNAAPGGNGGRPVTPPIVPPGGGGRKTRPDVFPPGSGEGRAIPNAQGGNLIRTGPGTNTPLVTGGAPGGQPKSTAEGDRHLRPGDTFAIVRKDIPPQDGQGGSWWEVVAPSGLRGFSRGVDPTTGQPNFQTIREPAPVPNAVAGVLRSAAPFGVAYDSAPVVGKGSGHIRGAREIRRKSYPINPARILQAMRTRNAAARIGAASSPPLLMTCRAPIGCFLRRAPFDGAEGSVIVPANAQVLVQEYTPGPKREQTSPGHGGWAKIRYFGPGMTVPREGFMLAEWLA